MIQYESVVAEPELAPVAAAQQFVEQVAVPELAHFAVARQLAVVQAVAQRLWWAEPAGLQLEEED